MTMESYLTPEKLISSESGPRCGGSPENIKSSEPRRSGDDILEKLDPS